MGKLSAKLGRLDQPGIGHRFALWILAFSTVVTLISTIFQLTLEFNRDVDDIESQLEQIKASYSNSLASSLWVTSQKDVQLQLDGVLRMSDMQYLEVRSESGGVVASAGHPHEKRILRKKVPLYFEYMEKPIYVGELNAVATLEGAYQRVKDKVVVILIAQTIKTFLVSLFILFLFQFLVGRYLNQIARHAEALGMGSAMRPLALARKRIEGEHPDELDQLVGAFNEMSRRLDATYHNLKESEENARLMVESVQDYAILRLDLQGRVASWNEGAQRMLGYRADEIVGRPHSLFYPPETAVGGRPAQLLEQAATEGRCEDEGWRLRKDGSRFWARVSITAMRGDNNQLIGYSKVTQDITPRKQAEDELLKYRDHLEERVAERTGALLAAQYELAQFKAALDQTLDCVFMFDPESLRFVYVNRGAVEQVGYGQEELLRMTPLDIKPEYDEPRFRNEVLQPLIDGFEPVHRFETLHRHKDGHELPVEISVQLVTLAGAEKRFISIVRDISERRKSEALVRERTLALEIANQELESFSYSVSHDLRAPLRGIDGFSLALLEDYGDQLDATARDYLNRVRNGALRMSALIDDLLKLSRVSRAVMDPGRVDLSRMAAGIVDHLREAAPDRAVEIRIQDGVIAEGDPGLLRVALDNLLDNAWKYSSKNPLSCIEFGCTERNGEIIYFVRDNGTGFDMAHAGKLFGAFQRLHHRDEFEGTGIGLATVKRIIHRHGGRIWADAAPGDGATFYFTLAARAACN